MFRFMFVYYTLNSVWVAEWPPCGKWLRARLAICSHCILSICNIYLFPVLVLRAGFAFWLVQFLSIAFLLLLFSCFFSFVPIALYILYRLTVLRAGFGF